MKRIGLTVTLIITAYFSYSQNTFPTTGNVGVGTLTPAPWASPYKVIDMFGYGYIYGSSNGTGYNGAGYGQTGWGNNTYYTGYSYALGTGAASYMLQGTGYLIFANAPSVTAGSPQTFTERFRIDNYGNVGIGTTMPLSKLHISGGGLLLDNANWYNAKSTTGVVAPILGIATDNNLCVGDLFGNLNSNLIIRTNGSNKLFISNTGNVGIGTNIPDQLLTVLGTIHAKQVNIALQVPGPDYVFAKNYKLKSLTEVSRYINLNKHLPEIPAARTMEKTGINVTELNMQLLKK